jgi:hypothetical protein
MEHVSGNCFFSLAALALASETLDALVTAGRKLFDCNPAAT